MPYCHICEAECIDITRHLFASHTRPEAANPGIDAGADTPSDEFEPGEADDGQTFCFQCSRDFHTAAALSTHLRDSQVHTRSIVRMRLGMPGYPSHDATGSHSLYPRSSRLSTDLGYDLDDSDSDSGDGGSSPQVLGSHGLIQERSNSSGPLDPPRNEFRREYTPQDDQGSSYNDNSMRQSPESPSEELGSESDENDDIYMDTAYLDAQNHSSAIPIPPVSQHTQHTQPPGFVTRDAQSPSPHHTPGAYMFMSPQPTVHPPGINAYTQEGMNMSYSYPKSELTPGTSHYYPRSGATHPHIPHTEGSSSSSYPPQPHNVPTRGRGIICPICLDPAEDVTSTLCGHIFCASCIKSALSLREACPVCNRATGRWSTHPIYPVF